MLSKFKCNWDSCILFAKFCIPSPRAPRAQHEAINCCNGGEGNMLKRDRCRGYSKQPLKFVLDKSRVEEQTTGDFTKSQCYCQKYQLGAFLIRNFTSRTIYNKRQQICSPIQLSISTCIHLANVKYRKISLMLNYSIQGLSYLSIIQKLHSLVGFHLDIFTIFQKVKYALRNDIFFVYYFLVISFNVLENSTIWFC